MAILAEIAAASPTIRARGLPHKKWKDFLVAIHTPPNDIQAWLDTIALHHIQTIAALQRQQAKLLEKPKEDKKPKTNPTSEPETTDSESDPNPMPPIPGAPCEGRCRGPKIDPYCANPLNKACRRKCGHSQKIRTTHCKTCGWCKANTRKIIGSGPGQTSIRDLLRSHCKCEDFRKEKVRLQMTSKLNHGTKGTPKLRGTVSSGPAYPTSLPKNIPTIPPYHSIPS